MNNNPGRPEENEYASFYAGYVARVPEDDIVDVLRREHDATRELLRDITPQVAAFRYAPDKWSVKEVVNHLIDTERVFAYRLLRFARGDRTPLPGFEQDGYVLRSGADGRDLTDLTAEFATVRQSTLALVRALDETAWRRRGVASDAEVSVRALAYIIAGHERHHVSVLKRKYLYSTGV